MAFNVNSKKDISIMLRGFLENQFIYTQFLKYISSLFLEIYIFNCLFTLLQPGEGGIILIPGATILDSFTDEEEEIQRSLERPPSPCDVTFINDNILIDGKSSLSSQKSKGIKVRFYKTKNSSVYFHIEILVKLCDLKHYKVAFLVFKF